MLTFKLNINHTILISILFWREIFINLRQDYENPVQRRYEFDILIENDATVTNTGTILIVTKNLFDNDPSITYEGPCVAPVSKRNILRILVNYFQIKF